MEIHIPKPEHRKPDFWDENDYLRETKRKKERAADNGDWVLKKGQRNQTMLRKRIWPRE